MNIYLFYADERYIYLLGERRGNRRMAAQRAAHPVRIMACMKTVTNELVVRGKLVNAQQLLEQLFDPEARPSMRWLRSQTKAKSIPHVRIGHLVFFDMDMVRAALAAKNLVRHRMSAPAAAVA